MLLFHSDECEILVFDDFLENICVDFLCQRYNRSALFVAYDCCFNAVNSFQSVLAAVSSQLAGGSTCDTLNDGKIGKGDSEALAALYKAWKALDTAFKKATGLDLFVDYHSREDEGDRYDEVDGMFISVCGLYQPTAKYKKLKEKFGDDVVERKFYVSFG